MKVTDYMGIRYQQPPFVEENPRAYSKGCFDLYESILTIDTTSAKYGVGVGTLAGVSEDWLAGEACGLDAPHATRTAM